MMKSSRGSTCQLLSIVLLLLQIILAAAAAAAATTTTTPAATTATTPQGQHLAFQHHHLRRHHRQSTSSPPFGISRPRQWSGSFSSSHRLKRVPDEQIQSQLTWFSERFNITIKDPEHYIESRRRSLTLDRDVIDDRARWIQERLGLTDDELNTIVRYNPDIMSSTPESLESTLEFLTKRLRLDKVLLKKTIVRGAKCFGMSVDENLAPKFDWLQSRLSLNDESLAKVITRYPNIVSLSLEKNLSPKFDRLQERLLLDDKSMGKLVIKHPTWLNCNLDDTLISRMDRLQEKLILDDKTLGRIIVRSPRLITDTVTLENLSWLQNRMTLNDKQMRTIFMIFPQCTAYKMEFLDAKISFFEERFNLNSTQVGKMVAISPTILGINVEDNLVPTMDWLQTRLLLSDDQLSKIARKFVQVFKRSIPDNLEPTLNWFQKRLKLSDAQLGELIVAFTPMVCLSITKNLEPKFELFVECLGEGTAIAMLRANPSLFGSSLENRIKPRIAEARAAGIAEIDRSFMVKICRHTPEKWETLMEKVS